MKEVSNEQLAVSSYQLAEIDLPSYGADHQVKSPVAELSHMVARGKVEASGDLGAKGQFPSAVNPWLVIKTKTKCEKFVRDKIQAVSYTHLTLPTSDLV